MLAKIKIKEKQYTKLAHLIIHQKLGFAIIESRTIEKSEIDWSTGDNCEVTLNCYSGDPGDLFTLGQKFKAIPDPVIMG